MINERSAEDTSELEWVKSSYSSSSNGNDCVEVAWVKSSYSSSGDGNDCVEVATTPRTIHVRDSKNTTGPQLTFTSAPWFAFLATCTTP
ncbi:DUF397 domain-containing protein [Streptomyces sp. NBC_01465]|uniref:DUF397 domain-containing protein n=1 Tax=Streptomyces sp. NBC_01465 TaxID=2903878 RepID=UPI002E345DFB|nr:DUF397 domain-containing protein [Streptomyces sp. NBC_01465]